VWVVQEDMDVVVAIHNNMNENTWRAVLEWESLHQPRYIHVYYIYGERD
jgi:hypothetical protein